MRLLFDGTVRVERALMFLQEVGSDPDVYVVDPGRDWEMNGLVFYGHEGGLVMAVGRDDGLVHIRVELHTTVPTLDLDWEEVAETSLRFRGTHLELTGHAEPVSVTIPRPGAFRFRFSASLMDEGRSFGERSFPLVVGPDEYVLQMWSAPAEPDVTIKETSLAAKDAHELVRRLFPPPARSRTKLTRVKPGGPI
jgi:hypothetical protein